MKRLDYTLTFNTPAFLGNAEQNAQWRTPPIKALLRQWWRVAYAAEQGFNVDVAKMRREEGLLFGHAWLEDGQLRDGSRVAARKSKVLIRLDQDWVMGSQQGVAPLSTGLDTSYAWFGLARRGGGQPDRKAIKAGEAPEAKRTLKLAVPDDYEKRFHTIMRLIDAFGLVGSRNRGGWGSLQVSPLDLMQPKEMSDYAQTVSDCLNRDWPASLAKDNNGLLLWEGKQPYESWDKAMSSIAGERKRVRSALKLATKDLRPILGFATPGRMPSPLRWKVIPSQNGKLLVRIFGMPHRIPEGNGKTYTNDQYATAWKSITDALDKSTIVSRSKP